MSAFTHERDLVGQVLCVHLNPCRFRDGRPIGTNQSLERTRELEAGSEFPGLRLNLEEIWEA